ncbi:unnamed protein product [Ranitomeya imitator]|uniref:Uncharacterized protein n=1 Tax=Ranitomeya imitator TaxID=111125 RepID=A0ABN9KWY5_9NEOB|nr:unnamed protein product [Ranitomeya imitator]
MDLENEKQQAEEKLKKLVCFNFTMKSLNMNLLTNIHFTNAERTLK